MRKVNLLFLFPVIFFSLLTSCTKEEETKPEFALAFQTTALGLDEKMAQATIKIECTSGAPNAGKIVIGVSEKNVSHGTHYKTTPTISGGKLTVDIPKGAKQATFSIAKIPGAPISSDAELVFTLQSVSGVADAKITGNTTLKVSFQAVSSPGGTISAQIGGPHQPNQVFIDLSLGKQKTAARDSWDLGFYCGDDFRVILNYSTFAMAKAVNKTDLSLVTAADTAGLSHKVRIGTAGADKFIDHPDGDLQKTSIARISEKEAENKVYLINLGRKSGTGSVKTGSVDVSSVKRGWKKVRILRDGNNYKIRYADLDAKDFSEATISKDKAFNFAFFSLEKGKKAEVEPPKAHWDFAFTVSSNIISFGPNTSGAYGYSDFVRTNGTAGVEVVAIATKDSKGNAVAGTKPYEDFSLADVSSQKFVKTNNAIGSSWRTVFKKVAYDYKYYVVKDLEGNYYKVQFLGLLNKEGVRGHSTFKYELLK